MAKLQIIHKNHKRLIRNPAQQTVEKSGSLILRIKDDCAAFDPATRREIVDPEDITKNIGIRMVYDMAYSVSYQSMLGLNVLTVVI